MDILVVGFFGEGVVEKRERLFIDEKHVFLKDGFGELISPQLDWEADTYGRVISTFTQQDDFIFFQELAQVRCPSIHEHCILYLLEIYQWVL